MGWRLQGPRGVESLLTAALLGPGDMVGKTHARQETTLLWMERKTFLGCLEVCPALCRKLARELSDRLRSATERIQSFAPLDRGRVALHLLDLAERYGHPMPGEGVIIPLPVTQGEIAEMVAATRERLTGRQAPGTCRREFDRPRLFS